jgi:Protein of unknown function VcgC/VcgE (DUF2780)
VPFVGVERSRSPFNRGFNLPGKTRAVPGLSQSQAILGAGSLLGLAKAKMPADQFSQVAGAIPGSDALVGEAVKQGPSQLVDWTVRVSWASQESRPIR